MEYWGQGGGSAVKGRPIAKTYKTIAGELQCPNPNPPKPHGAPPLPRGHTGHHRGREGDGQKAMAGDVRDKCRPPSRSPRQQPPPPGPPAVLEWPPCPAPLVTRGTAAGLMECTGTPLRRHTHLTCTAPPPTAAVGGPGIGTAPRTQGCAYPPEEGGGG